MTSCFPVFNLAYLQNFIPRLHNAQTATELQALVDELYGQIALLESNLQSQLDYISAIASLLISPTDLGALITWVENFITNFLTPYYKPYIVIPEQVAAIAAEVAEITAIIEEINSTKFPGITIVIPSIAPFCTI